MIRKNIIEVKSIISIKYFNLFSDKFSYTFQIIQKINKNIKIFFKDLIFCYPICYHNDYYHYIYINTNLYTCIKNTENVLYFNLYSEEILDKIFKNFSIVDFDHFDLIGHKILNNLIKEFKFFIFSLNLYDYNDSKLMHLNFENLRYNGMEYI